MGFEKFTLMMYDGKMLSRTVQFIQMLFPANNHALVLLQKALYLTRSFQWQKGFFDVKRKSRIVLFVIGYFSISLNMVQCSLHGIFLVNLRKDDVKKHKGGNYP